MARIRASDLPADVRRQLGVAPKRKRQPSELEESLWTQIRNAGLPLPLREARFHWRRQFRWDFAWIDKLLAVEIDGGGFVGGRHTRGAGHQADCEKQSLGAVLGWRVIRCTGKHISSGEALSWIQEALKGGTT